MQELSGRTGGLASYRLPILRRPRVGHRQPPVSRRHLPSLDPPATLSGDLRKPRVRIDRHRRADELQHPQVRKRGRVREALRQHDSIARRVLLDRRSRYSQRGASRSICAMKPGQSPSGCARSRIHKKYSTTFVSTSVPSTSKTASTSARPLRRSTAARTELDSDLTAVLPVGCFPLPAAVSARDMRTTVGKWTSWK